MRPLAVPRDIQITGPDGPDGCNDYVLTDRQRGRQVLINLPSNAIKYNHDEGTITVGCATHDPRTLRITVTDTGQGTTFWIDLPITAPPAGTTEHDPAPVPVATGDHRLLLVDDNLANLKVVEAMLRLRPGITVLPAMQATVALDLARDHHPDIIILDLGLPDLPGRDVLARLKVPPRTATSPPAPTPPPAASASSATMAPPTTSPNRSISKPSSPPSQPPMLTSGPSPEARTPTSQRHCRVAPWRAAFPYQPKPGVHLTHRSHPFQLATSDTGRRAAGRNPSPV